jgi:hypothetical protein
LKAQDVIANVDDAIVIELPIPGGSLVRRVEDRILNYIGHGSTLPVSGSTVRQVDESAKRAGRHGQMIRERCVHTL